MKKTGALQESTVHQTLTRMTDHSEVSTAATGMNMQRLRLKADGRIVELRDGREFPLAPSTPIDVPASASAVPAPAVRDLRRRAQLTQIEFAARLGVPVDTIRNWEQGKRLPRGPARALLTVLARAPEAAFAALEGNVHR